MIIIRISGETLIIILNLKVTLWSKFSKEIWNLVFKHIFYQKVIRDLYGTVLTYNLQLAFSIKISVPCTWIFSALLYIFFEKASKDSQTIEVLLAQGAIERQFERRYATSPSLFRKEFGKAFGTLWKPSCIFFLNIQTLQ